MFSPEQEVPPTHARAPSEDHLLYTERAKVETNWLAYIVIGLGALSAACVLVILLTLAILPSAEIPVEHASTFFPPLVVPTIDETELSSNAFAKPLHATTAAHRTIASAATYTTPAPADAPDNTIASTAPYATSGISFASTTFATTSSAATAPGAVNRPFKKFTRGKLYYRSAYLDETRGYLFVGAMYVTTGAVAPHKAPMMFSGSVMRIHTEVDFARRENLFKLHLKDISLEPVTELHLPAPEQSMSSCRVRGGDQLGSDVDCRNHIREVHPIREGSTLYICGTNSRNPTDWQVQAADLSLVPEAERVPVLESNKTGGAEGRCSDFISRDTSSLWLDDAPVPGVSSVVSLWHLAQGRHSIYRSAIPAPGTNKPAYPFLKTDDADGATLSEPHSVGALSFGAHAYFIFREQAAELRPCGVNILSAMARVCKNDFGGAPGTGRRVQLWTSYMKVRLVCTNFLQFPENTRKQHFTFDAIYASSWVSELETGVLFGAFTTVTHGYPDSAVCAFRREDIERAFNSTRFIEVTLSRDALSKPVSANTTTYTGRGAACTADSRTLDPAETNFLLSHPLLAGSPKQRHNRAFYTLSGVAFRAIAVSVFSDDWGSWVICYVATDTGLVVKLVQDIVTEGVVPPRARQVDSFKVSTDEIRKMLVSVQHRSLYVFTDSDVRQYQVDDCSAHLSCASCVADPFCGWDGTWCIPHCDGTTKRTC